MTADDRLDDILNPALLMGEGNLVTQVHRTLRTAIVQVRLRPGAALSEKDIARCLNVSKTPIREALIRLVEERLVTVVPKSGTRVAPINIERFREGCFARLHIEVAAVAQAAALRSDEDIIRMKANLSRQREALDNEAYWEFFLCDEQFHALILKAAGLKGLVPIMEVAKVEVDRIRSLKNRLGVRRTETVIGQHEEIVDAIAARDPGRASAAIRNHLGEVDKRIWELGEDHALWSYIESVSRPQPKTQIGIVG
ncbi:GntR family transcriptional regulator [Phyllobacterium bourgognense]|uniref:GntR family transcriptional regulator n=1 Tax=Phyllobacterium bourgognense TaxID=314236 RepID=A0A368YME3_9HYPH|nr:GntR family transcriptional regulator [Phyllobacterium bourgognense]RCW80087.1 GntR family transcriptional regulator [Phyllobacterium bourgognense]